MQAKTLKCGKSLYNETKPLRLALGACIIKRPTPELLGEIEEMIIWYAKAKEKKVDDGNAMS